MLKYPLLGKLNAFVVLAAWLSLLSSVAALAYLKLVTSTDRNVFPLILLFGAFALFVLSHFVLSRFVRCPHCDCALTAQGFAKPKYGDWSRVVLQWFTGSVVCIHCGTRIRTSGRGDDL
jgi:hypothetical protein